MIIESDAGKEASAQIEGPFKTTTLMMKGVYLEGVCETSPDTYVCMNMYIYIFTRLHNRLTKMEMTYLFY